MAAVDFDRLYHAAVLRERLLETSWGYRAFRRLISADHSMAVIVSDHVRPTESDRVLDVGCGNADLASFLPRSVSYLGIDNNSKYVKSARARGLDVIEAGVADLATVEREPFDAIVLVGVLHHLDDAVAERLVQDCGPALNPGGRFISVDPVKHVGQVRLSRAIMALDRGKFIRDASGYTRLIASGFSTSSMVIRRDLLPFPYAHCVIEATQAIQPMTAIGCDRGSSG